MQSLHLTLGLPLPRVPTISVSIASLITCSSSTLLLRWPNHLNLYSWIFFDASVTLADPPTYWFLILSILVTPLIHLSIFIPVTSSLCSCAFFIGAASSPYASAGLTTALCTLPFSVKGTFLSHITPVTFLQLFHPACTRCFISLSISPAESNVDPRY